jgi:hypothetical protein
MNYIDANELVFNNDKENGIYSGGFSVNSIMMKGGMSPIITLNNGVMKEQMKEQMKEGIKGEMKGGMNNVSDIFNDLVVPNWTLSYHNNMYGGSKLEKDVKYDNIHDNHDDDDTINDDIHDKLLDLVKHYDKNGKERKKGGTRKSTLPNSKKTSTKKRK